MGVKATRRTPRAAPYGPEANGLLLTPEEFDHGEFEEGHRYELINGVLIVAPSPLEQERDPNEELGFLLRLYQLQHPQGAALDKTLPEQTVATATNRRRPDRVLWVGLGRLPTRADVPAVVVEFLSEGRRNRERDLQTKRGEYLAAGVREYWVFDRFARRLRVFRPGAEEQAVGEQGVYTTPLLPGFELPVARLQALADAWDPPRRRRP